MQPEDGTPGLFLQCNTGAQREAIMRALGWRPESERNATLKDAIQALRDIGAFSGVTLDDLEEMRRDD